MFSTRRLAMRCGEHMGVARLEIEGQGWPRSEPFVLSQLRTCICHQGETTPSVYHMSIYANEYTHRS